MRRTILALLLVHAACATARKGPAREADQELPSAAEVGDAADALELRTARAHETSGDAHGVANDQARADWGAAAARYRALAERPSMGDWRVPLRHRASTLYLRAQRWDAAAEAAQGIVDDREASDASRALGARFVATAWLGAANAAVKAGQLEKLDLGTEGKEQRRDPPAAWQRVLAAADAYLRRADADPEPGRSAGRGFSAAELALVAAEVRYAFGDVEDARRRLEAALERWAADAELVEQSVPLYLATFLARADDAGYVAAVDRLRERIAAELAKDPLRDEALAKQLEALSRARAGARFAAGEELMRKGRHAEAAGVFAAAAEQDPADAANALHNAAVAWDAAGDPARSAALRERLLEEHAEAAVTAENALRLAAYRSRQGDHGAAVRLYEEFLRRWPLSPERCLALRNVAAELDLAARQAEAASRYLAFGGDAGCAKANPDAAARALVRAGALFEAQARTAYSVAASLEGVADPGVRREASEARRRLGP
jgi:hypothetical protein